MLDEAWIVFRGGLAEVRTLLRTAKAAQSIPASGRLVSEQQIFVRAAIVLLAAHLEGFFKAVATDYVESIPPDDWARLRPGARRFVSTTVVRYLQDQCGAAGLCDEESKQEALRRSVILASRWLKKPRRLSESKRLPRLEGFYRQRGAASVEALLREFHGGSFFAWLPTRGIDRGQAWTVLEGVVNARNEIAHGDAQLSLTLAEVRRYVAVSRAVTGAVRAYLLD